MAVNLGARSEPILTPRERPVAIGHAGRTRASGRSSPNRFRPALRLLPAVLGALLLALPLTQPPHQVATTGSATSELALVPQETGALEVATAEPTATGDAPGRKALDPSEARTQVWIVARGETLWSIARQIAPDRDPRSVVEALRQVNRLESAALRVGQALQIPPEQDTR